MNLSNRKPLYLALALTLAAPLAFAQSTTPQSATPTQDTTNAASSATQDATNAASTATQDATSAATQDATAATQSTTQSATQDATAQMKGEPQKKNWSDLDIDKNGSLSATEAASVQNLSSVFAKADANADGELTQDEYKAYLAANGKGEAKSDSGG